MSVSLQRCLRHPPPKSSLCTQMRWTSSSQSRRKTSSSEAFNRTPAREDALFRKKVAPQRARPVRLVESRGRRPQEPSDDIEHSAVQSKHTSLSNKVQLDVNGQLHRFSPILLRDLCECSQCIDPSTNQKYRPATDIPASIRPRAIAQTDSGVSILWDDDVPGYGRQHATDISIDTLRDYIGSGVTGISNSATDPRTLWTAEEYGKLPDMSYDEYMQSDSALYRALRQLHTHGLAFLTGVPESEKSVSAVAERIGPIKNTFYGYTWDVRSVPEAKNVAYTSQDLGFHMDLLYMQQPPHLQFLHCIRSSSTGGASLFTDSLRSVSDLLDSDLEAFETLRQRPVGYHYNHPSSALYYHRHRVIEFARDSPWKGGLANMIRSWDASRRRDEKGGNAAHCFGETRLLDYVTAIAWSPPFQAPFGRRPAQNEKRPPIEFANENIEVWHGAARKFNALIHRSEMVYERLLKPGECVLFDNRRVLHARRAFEVGDVGKERWLRGAYLDKDPYLSKMRVLERQLGGQTAEVDSGEYYERASAATG